MESNIPETVDGSGLMDFIKRSLENKKAPYKRVIIGTINNDAQIRIKNVCGVNVKEIDIDNHSIIHTLANRNHNLEPEDILLPVDVINTSVNIELSDKKHQENQVLVFKKDIDGDITFLTEVRVKNGYLFIFNAWRQKKARSRRSSDAAE